jgi:hypothetical protein
MKKNPKKENDLKKDFLLLLPVVLFALLLRLYFFVGPNMNDDIDYIFSAHEVSEGKFYPIFGGSINAIRSMMTLPVALSFFLFGTNRFTASIYPLFCSLGTIVLTYFIGKFLFSRKVGLISAIILSFLPVDIAFSTQLVPTVPTIFFISAFFLLFLYAEKYMDLNKKRKARIFYLLSGIMVGLSYLTNEIPLFLIPLIFLSYIICKRRFRSYFFIILLGFAMVFLVESSFMFIKTGDFFHRPKVIHDTEVMIGTNTDLNYYPRVMLKITNVDYQNTEGNLGIFIYILIISSLVLLFKREKNAYFIILSIILIMCYFEFGVMTVGFKPIAKWVRYLVVFGPFMSIIIASSITKVNNTILQSTAIILLFIFSIPYTVGSTKAYYSWTSYIYNTYEFLKTLPEKPIFTDQESFGSLEFYFGYKKNIKLLEYTNLTDVYDSYVIIDGSRGAVESQSMRDALPDFAKNVPSNWKLIKKIEGGIITPKVYYVPKI